MMKRTYEIHTGNELSLMLSGKKPMAIFYRCVGENFDEMDGQDFEKYVSSGQMTKTRFFVYRSSLPSTLIYTVFTLLGEEWRAQIYRQLKKHDGWSRDLEIIEGTLLGYNLAENMEHINEMYGSVNK